MAGKAAELSLVGSNIGALIIRIGFAAHSTRIIIRNPQSSKESISGVVEALSGANLTLSPKPHQYLSIGGYGIHIKSEY